MPNGDYKKLVKGGDDLVIPAPAFNSWQRSSLVNDPSNVRQRVDSRPGLREGLVYVQNNSGADRDIGEVLGISGVLVGPNDNTSSPADSLSEFQTNYALTGVTPASATHTGKFVITFEPIKNNDIGLAYIFGICPVKIGSGDTSATALDVKDGDATQLTSNSAGVAQVLESFSTADADGNYWALVRFQAAGGGTETSGQYQFMLDSMVSQNQRGWDFARGHPMI